ncbi:MAG TPA: phenylalanine--tRNA ligase subunit beta [Stenomitos sp.]
MRIPLNWLNDYFAAPLTDVEAIRSALTNAGLEVEGIERVAPGFEKVVTGKIVAADKHPNADRLRICQTDLGTGELLQIVTGAQNVQVGDIIPVALGGAKLPNGLEIKPSKLRGIDSFGMYCSRKELGLEGGVDGVEVLPPDTPLGVSVAQVMGVGGVVIEVAVLANRPDALSVLGVARELSAAGLGTLKLPQPPALTLDGEPLAAVTLEASDLCPRYAAQVVSGLTVGESPDWMKERLELAGIRAISNVVDVTNFVLLEMGQPLHAFDLAKIAPKTLRPRRAQAGERITTLDGVERTLDADMLVIADEQGPQAIAGVMGGAHSQVTEATTRILLESAYFDPSSVRKTGKKLGLSSESSYRFERGVDPEHTVLALARAAQLLAETAGGKAEGPVVDQKVAPDFPQPLTLTLRPARVERVLGVLPDLEVARRKLAAIGFEIASGEPWQVRVPGWRRHDVTREIDLIEEIARLVGYEQVPATLMPLSGVATLGRREEIVRRVRTALEGAGLHEAITPSLTSEAALKMAKAPVDEAVILANPLAEMAMLRTSMLPGLLEVARFNHYQGISNVALYEVGKTYHRRPDGSIVEPRWVVFLVMGEQATGVWKRAPEVLSADFYWGKGLVERVFEAFGTPLPQVFPYPEDPALHPGRAARLEANGTLVGFLGEVHPEVYAAYDLPVGGRAAVAWLSLEALEAVVPTEDRHFHAFGRIPAVLRDLALVVPETTMASSVVATVREMGGELLEAVEVFDRYQGPQVPEGKVSLGLRLRYRDPQKTLSDEEVEPVHRRIVERAQEAYGAAVRDR